MVKIISTTYKVLQSSSPHYLRDIITIQPSRSTRSSSLLSVLLFPHSHSVTIYMLMTPSCSYPSSPTRFERTEGTGWKFRSIIKLEIHTVKYNPLKGGTWIDLPGELKAKRACINMKNTDNQCFKWAVTRALNSTGTHDERIDTNLREKAEELNWNGIDFPVSWEGIKKFERLNKTISVNVYGWTQKKIY